MSSRQCPLCGKIIEESDQKFCKECRNQNERVGEFSKSYIASNDSSRKDDSESLEKIRIAQEKARSSKKKRRRIWWLLVCFLLLAGACVATYFYYQEAKRIATEDEKCWNITSQKKTNDAYLFYLQQFPNGMYAKEAKNQILQHKSSIEKQWQILQKKPTEQNLLVFLRDNQGSPYAHQAKMLIDSIAWSEAQSQDTEESYKVYLEKAKNRDLLGAYQAMAQEKYDYYAQMEFVGGEEWQEVEKDLLYFFHCLSSDSLQNLKSCFANHVKTFYNLNNTNSSQIIVSIESQKQKEGIESYEFYPDVENMKIQKDINSHYIIDLNIKEGVYYKQKGKSKVLKKNLHLLLDSNRNVIELFENSMRSLTQTSEKNN